MQFELLKYEKSGRTYKVLDDLGQDTGKLAYRSKVGEQQTFFNGEWSPYAVDGDRVLFGHQGSEIEFQAGRQVIKKAGARLIGSSRFFVERETSPGVWETVNHGPATRNLAHNYPEEGKLTGYLEFPSAPYDLQIGLTVGGRRDVKLGFRFRSPIAGRVRFVWINEDIDELPGDGFALIEEGGEPDRPRVGLIPRKTIGLRFGNVKFRWTYAEADEREISVINRGVDRKDLSITFGPFDVNAGEWLEVSPDTFGAIENDDDCCQEGSSYHNNVSGYIYVGYWSSNYNHGGMTWSNVTVPSGSTIESGTKITIFNNYCGGAGTNAARLEIVDARSVTAWSSGYLPTNTTRHATTVAWNDPGSGTRNSPELSALVQQRLDDDHQSGDDIAICWMETSNSGSGTCGGDAEESGNGAALTVVYTPPWSSSISPSASPSLSPSMSPSISPSVSPSESPSISPSESPSVSPSVLATDYTKGAYETLPADETELSTYYTEQQITNVGADNGTRVNQQAYGMYAIHQFIEDATGYTSASITWNGQSDLAPSTASVVLEIFNHNSSTWEQLDSESSAGADTDFNLAANVSDLTNYKAAGTNEITCRVYQLAPE